MAKQIPVVIEIIEGSEIKYLQPIFKAKNSRRVHLPQRVGQILGNDKDYAWQHMVREFIFLIFHAPVMFPKEILKSSKWLKAAQYGHFTTSPNFLFYQNYPTTVPFAPFHQSNNRYSKK